MSTWLDVEDEVAELASDVAEHLGCTQERVIEIALIFLAVQCGMKLELPRKENEDAG